MRRTLRTSGSSSTSSTGPSSAGCGPGAAAALRSALACALVVGSTKRTCVPWPGVLRMRMLPPDWRTNPYTIDRPRPLPLPKALVVKKGSNTRCSTAGSMPLPVSLMSICT